MKSQSSRRRRRGTTSPPLVGIEPNPGPKTGAKRRVEKKKLTTPPKTSQPSSIHLSPESLKRLEKEFKSGKSQEAIIKSGEFSKKVVARWAKVFKEKGCLENATRGRRRKLEEDYEVRDEVLDFHDEEEDEKYDDDEDKPDEEKEKKGWSQLSEFDKGQIIMAYKVGESMHGISERVGRARSTVRMWIERWIEEGTVERREGSGRPRALLEGEDRYIKILSLKDRFLTASDIAKVITVKVKNEKGELVEEAKVTEQTIRNRLREFGLYARRPRKKPLLTGEQKRARLQWARAHLHWTPDMWKRVLWTDESSFRLFPGKGVYVRRRVGEEFDEKCVEKTVKHGGGGIMVWGCFHGAGVGVLKRVEGKIDSEAYRQILIHQAMPELKELIAQEPEHVVIFQHDNAPVHTAKKVQAYLETKEGEFGGKMTVMSWPSQSPDLNPIENVWGYIKRRLRKRKDRPSNLDTLFEQILEEWNAVPHRVLLNLIESMPSRAQMVIKSKGGGIKY
jgi:Transposase and inactivated derivatives